MIGKVRGVLEYQEGEAWGVTTSGGVTYECVVPRSGHYHELQVGASLELWIHTHVREDALDLFGFLSESERLIFRLLITVSGVGPKVAINVLSSLNAQELIDAILEKDESAFTRVSGIGKKTAERLLLELHDRVQKKVKLGEFKAGAVRESGQGSVKNRRAIGPSVSAFVSARDALLSLGYKQQEAQEILERISTREAEVQSWTSQDWIRESLKEIRSLSS